MSKRAVSYLIISFVLFSLSASFVSAPGTHATHPGTCLNPPGSGYPNQCGGLGHAPAGSYCYCDPYCVTPGDCCADYDSVCLGGGTGGGGNNTTGGGGNNTTGGGGSTTCPNGQPPIGDCNAQQATCVRTCGSPSVTYWCASINNGQWSWRTAEQFAAGCHLTSQACSYFKFPESCNAAKGGNPSTNIGTCYAISGGPNHLDPAWRYDSEQVCVDGIVAQSGNGGCQGLFKSQIPNCNSPACGTQGQTCCFGNTCSSGLTCQQNTCNPPPPDNTNNPPAGLTKEQVKTWINTHCS